MPVTPMPRTLPSLACRYVCAQCDADRAACTSGYSCNTSCKAI